MEDYQIETSVALGALLIATVALACNRCCSRQLKTLQAATFVMSILMFLTLISGSVLSVQCPSENEFSAIQSTLDISNSDISNSAKLEASF